MPHHRVKISRFAACLELSVFAGYLVALAACGNQDVLAPPPSPPGPDPRILRLAEALNAEGFVVAEEFKSDNGGYTLSVSSADTNLVIREGWADHFAPTVGGGRSIVPSQTPTDRPASTLRFVIEPSSNEDPNANNDITYRATGLCGMEPTSFRVDSIRVSPLANSGGHKEAAGAHPAPRPVGTYTETQGNALPFFGFFIFSSDYFSDSLSGDEDHKAWFTNTDPTSDCFQQQVMNLSPAAIRYGGLVWLPPGPHHFEDSITSSHFDVFYLRPYVRDMTLSTAANFFRDNTSRKLRINSASLIFGGLYDTEKNWRRPHRLHRIGRDVDLDAGVGPEFDTDFWFDRVKDAGTDAGFGWCREHVGHKDSQGNLVLDHVHCRAE